MNQIRVAFHKIPSQVYKLPLSSSELLVLNYLISLSGFKIVHPSRRIIALSVKLSKKTVDRAIKSLHKNGFIEYNRGGTKNGKKKANEYRICFHNIDPKCVIPTPKQINKDEKNKVDLSDIFEDLNKYNNS
jgi:DNA-binding transcriptional regulator YhcF (GntR family)